MMDSVDKCSICHNLEPEAQRNEIWKPADEWVTGLFTSQCIYCRLVVQALEWTEPHDVYDKLNSNPEALISISTDQYGKVEIYQQDDGWTHCESEFQLFVSNDDASVKVGNRELFRDLSLIAGDASMWSFLRECLASCLEAHDLCRSEHDSTWFPERLLTWSSENEGRDYSIRVVDTQHELPTSQYIALSYCWGCGVPLRLTTKNFNRLHHRVFWQELPRLFQDFIRVGEQLGIRYLWIDSLCIVQDDPNEWARQSSDMDKVYQNALFTVAAITPSDSHKPFLGIEAPTAEKRLGAQTFSLDFNDSIHGRLPMRIRRTQDIYHSATFRRGPLDQRCWTFQEQVLAPRLIEFNESEVVWICNSATYCEHGVLSEGESLISNSNCSQSRHKLTFDDESWMEVIRRYCCRQLTYPIDRLPALAGIASQFRAQMNTSYLAGLWMSDFPRCLGWYHENENQKSHGILQPSLASGVPSWSWASVRGRIGWTKHYVYGSWISHGEALQIQSRVTLLRVSCSPATDNEFGPLLPGSYIELSGQTVEAEWESDMFGCGSVSRKGFKPNFIVPDCHLAAHKRRRGTRQWRHSVRRLADENRENGVLDARIKGTILCLLVYLVKGASRTHACVLILSKTHRTQHEYERIAMGAGGNIDGPEDFVTAPRYIGKTNTELWEGWRPLGQWENWEHWFSGAETRTLRIL